MTPNTGLQFTQDWFHWAPELWEQIIPKLPARKAFMEIGSYEGRSMAWTIEHMMKDGGTITCIDTWEGGEEHEKLEKQHLEKTFDYNARVMRRAFPKREIRKAKGTSYQMLTVLATQPDSEFDFIYVDGSHLAKDVISDACLAWPMLKPEGVMVFDDYMWGDRRDALHRPKMAVDAFTSLFAEEVNLMHVGYQYVVQKLKEETK
jgi:predicted O-methyltransferase YrrM